MDTNGAEESVLYREVSFARVVVGVGKGVLIEGFHCMCYRDHVHVEMHEIVCEDVCVKDVLYCVVQLDQRWQERYDYDIKGFAVKQKTTYSKHVVYILLHFCTIHTLLLCIHISSLVQLHQWMLFTYFFFIKHVLNM